MNHVCQRSAPIARKKHRIDASSIRSSQTRSQIARILHTFANQEQRLAPTQEGFFEFTFGVRTYLLTNHNHALVTLASRKAVESDFRHVFNPNALVASAHAHGVKTLATVFLREQDLLNSVGRLFQHRKRAVNATDSIFISRLCRHRRLRRDSAERLGFDLLRTSIKSSRPASGLASTRRTSTRSPNR